MKTDSPEDKATKADTETGKVVDFISKKSVQATPEEVEAVQPFAIQLVQDYGYPIDHIRTRPQWHVKASPSDTKKKYPVDIAVFNSPDHSDSELHIVVECKKKTRKDGRAQLEDYLRLSRASLGVWFNGNQRLFLRKLEAKGKVAFEEIPNIPRFGQRVEDVGLYQRNTLRPTHNLRSVFRAIRNYLAANAVGMTRDESLAQEIINIIFCKIYDERFTRPTDTVRVRFGLGEDPKKVSGRVKSLFAKVVEQYDDVFDKGETIKLDDASVAYVVGELQQYSLVDCDRDVVADAFETFIGPSLKGGQGQFFTPRNVVHLVAEMVSAQAKDRVIDPACGSGGFLVEVMRSIWLQVEARGKELAWPASEIDSEKQKVAIRNIRGIDKDRFLSKVAKAYMAVLGDGRGGVFCENSLVDPKDWNSVASQEIRDGIFNVVVTNPPFGKKLKIDDQATLARYELGHKWALDKRSGAYRRSGVISSQSPQVLFIERCLNLLAPGGRMGIVLPESLLCNPSHKYIVQYILSRAHIRAVVSMPEELFQPYTHAKTAVVLLEKCSDDREDKNDSRPIFMAVARWCGHDSRGHEIPYDDIPEIIERFQRFNRNDDLQFDHLGFTVSPSDIEEFIYLPKYYNPELTQRLSALSDTHDLVRLGDLADAELLSVNTGHEVGKLAYGTGPIPFIRTSDVANWEIKSDPKHGVSKDIYERLRARQDVEVGDILMVRDGTYLVGTCAMVTELDERILFQSHILKFKSRDHNRLDPYLLLALLSAPIVKEQIWAKRFTQDIIDTLGGRWKDLILPIPKSKSKRDQIAAQVENAIRLRMDARLASRRAIMQVAPHDDYDPNVEYDFLVIGR